MIASATKNFFGSHRAIPKNPTISDDEWTRVMALELGGGSIKSTLPYDRMVDNSFALEATKRFGIAW